MRAVWALYFALVTLVLIVVEMPREDLARYYLSRLANQTGVTVQWQQGDFGFRSAHLQNVTLASHGTEVLDLSSADAVFGLSGVDFTLSNGKGNVTGTYETGAVDVKAQEFPLSVGANWLTNLTVSGTGHFVPPEQSGTGDVEVHGVASPNLDIFHVQGPLQAKGDYRLRQGNLEFHAGLLGDKMHGHVDLMATHSGQLWLLSGTITIDINGQVQTLRIAGTSADPQFQPMGPGTAPPTGATTWPSR